MTAARRRILKIVLITAVVLLLLLTVGAGIFLYNFLVDRDSPIHMNRVANVTDDGMMLRSGAGGTAEDWEWFEACGERISIQARDGAQLVGQLIPSGTGGHRYVITCHGTGGRRIHMAGYAREFHALGFHVLAPDARAHGESGGDRFDMGWTDRLDVLDWAQELIARDPEAEILLHGVSLGGATVLMAAGEDLPPNIKAAISDSGFTVAEDQLLNYTPWFMVPGMKTLSLINRVTAGYGFRDVSPLAQVRHSRIPLLFIQGDADSVVPVEMLYELYDAAGCEKEKLVIEGADHTMSYKKDPERYWATVEAFAAKYME